MFRSPIIRCFFLMLLPPLLTSSVLAQDAKQLEWLVKGIPDPAAIHARDGSEYIFATGKGIAIWRSTDRKTWLQIGRVFEQDVPGWAHRMIPGADSVWAPDIQFANGKYYLYYSVSTFGSQRSVIGFAVNSTLNPLDSDYRWEDRGLVIESFPDKNNFNAIDPAMFVDGRKAYLVWGSYWTGIKGTELDLETGKPKSPLKVTALAARANVAPTAIEGAYVIKRSGFYYLFVSWGFCCAQEKSTYKVLVGRSKSPLGPYTDRSGRKMDDGGGTLLLMSDARWRGPGHNSVLSTRQRDYLVYHVVDAKTPDAGRILQLRPIIWKQGWPTVGLPVGHEAYKVRHAAVVGRWQHMVNNQDRYDIFLEPSGEITGTKGKAEWELKGLKLLMKWHDPNAPNGMWIDSVLLDSKSHRYQGQNQLKSPITGSKVK